MDNLALLLPFGKSVMFTLAAILPVMNPLAIAPLFAELSRPLNHGDRALLAWRIGQHTTVLLTAALLVGSHVLSFFGVSLPVVRVAGGLIVASMAWQMLNTQESGNRDKAQMAQTLTAADVNIRAFYPMTFPLTCGPGSISVAIAVGAGLQAPHLTTTIANFGGSFVAIALMGVIVTLTYRYATTLMRRLGEVGHIVFQRLMAFILFCVGLEILWEGLRALWMQLPATH